MSGTEERAPGDPINPARTWIGFGLLAAGAAIAAIGSGEEEAARAVGAAFGAIFIGLVIAAVIRLVWARGKAARAFELSGFLLAAGIAAVVCALLAAAGNAADEDGDETVDQALDAIARGAETCPRLAEGRLGGGFELAVPTAAEVRRLGIDPEGTAVASAEIAGVVGNAETYVIRTDGEAAGVAVAIPVDYGELGDDAESARADILAGIRDGAAEQGTDVEDATIAGLDGVTYRTPFGDSVAATVLGCQMLLTSSVDPETAVLLTERVIEAQPPGI